MVYEYYLVSFLCLYNSVLSLFCSSVLPLLNLDMICNQNYMFE